MNFSDLKSLEHDASVSKILQMFFNADSDVDLLGILEDDDILGYWAACNDTVPSVIYDAIDASLNNVANFRIVKEVGSGGGWPECELSLSNGIILCMDWVIDE